jgi:hypothetical protein
VVRAYVFIQTWVGMGPQVASDVGRIQGILSSEGVTGPYDVIVRAEAPDLDATSRTTPRLVQLLQRRGVIRWFRGGEPQLPRVIPGLLRAWISAPLHWSTRLSWERLTR